MRDVQIVAKCDRCLTQMRIEDDAPLEKWVINGRTYRIELCGTCQLEMSNVLMWLDNPKPTKTKGTRTGGAFARVRSECPDCNREFSTPAGLSQHRSQTHGWTPDPTPVKAGAGPHKCGFCDDEFPTRSGRHGHERMRHHDKWLARKEEENG